MSNRRLAAYALWLAATTFSLTGGAAAFAGHYHNCCGFPWATGHALVHGGSTTDGVWHGRSTNNNVLATRHRAAGSTGAGVKGQSFAGAGATCQIMVTRNQFIANDTECHAWGYENKNYYGELPENWPHFHDHHNPCGGIQV